VALAAALSLVVVAGTSFAQRGDTGTVVETTEELSLAVGENKTISASDVNNYSEGTKGVADVKLTTDGKRFVIVGRAPGSTTLLLLNKDGSQTKWVINVFSRSPDSVEREVKQLLEGTSGVRVRRVGARFFIEGGVTADSDVKRIERIAEPVERKVNIRIDFYFVQYERNSNYAFGVNWPSRIGGEAIQSEVSYDFLSGTVTTAQASVINQPLPGLDIAARNGWAKVLKQSTVITTNGTEATFESGGEQNYPISAGLTANSQPITYGTNVTVLPRFDSDSGELEVKISADVSDLIPAIASTSLPGRSTSKLTTLVNMKLGESLVLSGIRTQSQRRSTGGLPLLSEIPILGLFFGSESQTREDVEGAVFIIPSVVESLPRDSMRLVNSAASQFEEYSGDIESINAYNKRPPMSGKKADEKE
jgi:pilus assembly protein CpaC